MASRGLGVFPPLAAAALLVLLTSCTPGGDAMAVKISPYGTAPDGTKCSLYTLVNAQGVKAVLTDFGAILVALEVPDRKGAAADITLGYDTLEGWVKDSSYFGATVGRCGNRIAKAKFTLDGKEYVLAANDGENHLHGGVKGFNKVVWKAKPVTTPGARGVEFSYLSKDGEEGYPGNLACTVTYMLTDAGELSISYGATTDKATPINLTHHSYFNLAGQGAGDVLGHELMLAADRYTPVDAGLIPTGELAPVKGTPMDFTTATAIGARIDQVPGGYDHNYVLTSGGGKLSLAARVYEPTSGRVMEISTTEPGIQFYSGNFLNGSVVGRGGKRYQKHYGFCLETQHFPDAPNKPAFPSVILRPGERYTHVTVHKFSTR